MLKNAHLLANIGANTAENEPHFMLSSSSARIRMNKRPALAEARGGGRRAGEQTPPGREVTAAALLLQRRDLRAELEHERFLFGDLRLGFSRAALEDARKKMEAEREVEGGTGATPRDGAGEALAVEDLEAAPEMTHAAANALQTTPEPSSRRLNLAHRTSPDSAPRSTGTNSSGSPLSLGSTAAAVQSRAAPVTARVPPPIATA